MSDKKQKSKQDFWSEATKLAPGSTMTQLRYDLTSLWLLACHIRSTADNAKARGVKKAARDIERIAFRWMELSETLPVETRPPLRRNCDVGMPEEHSIRFFKFCASNARGTGLNQSCKPTCPCIDCSDICQCLCRWAQMPYTEGNAE